MRTKSLSVVIEGKGYTLNYDPKDPLVAPSLLVAYRSQLARDFMPVILDPKGYGSKPCLPEFIAYRLITESHSLAFTLPINSLASTTFLTLKSAHSLNPRAFI